MYRSKRTSDPTAVASRSDKAQDFKLHTFTRRTLLKTTVVGLGIAGLIGTGYEFMSPVSASGVKHPGMLHTQADFDRMRAQVNAGTQPWIAGWNKLIANSHSSATYKPNPQATIVRGAASGRTTGSCTMISPPPTRTRCAGRSAATPRTLTQRVTF